MSDPITPNPYETLGVDKDADLVTIRKAHRKLVLQCHPDRVRDDNKENAAQKFTEVQQAYYVLSDETSRQQHDARVRLSELRWEVREERYRGYKPSQASRVWEARPRGMNSQGASSHQERPRATESNNTLFHREKTRVRKSEHANDRYPLHERRRPLNGTREREESRTERDTNRALYNEGGSKDRDTGANSLPGKSTTTNRIPCPPVWGRFGDKERRRQAIPSHLTREKRVTSISRKRESKRSQTLAYSSPEQTLIRSLEQHEKHRRQQEIFEQQLLRFLGPPPPIPKRIAKKQTASILALEGFVDDNFVCTKPDTGARANLMALSFAESIGLHLFDREPESQVSFLMANGCLINSIGRVTARWRFKKGETESYTISFYVFAECCFDVIIGDSFLRETQTMSTNEHRLSWVPRPEWALYVRRINLLGCPSQRMKGKLGGDEVFALADSGAEGGNLVSYEYAKRRGWLTGDLFGKRNLLQFPDGSQSRTEGQVRKVWRYHGALGYEKKIAVVFDILYDLPFDVLFGQDFLQATDAFNKHKTCFHDFTTNDDSLGFSLVIWKEKNNGPAGETVSATGASALEHEAEDELERRAKNNQSIRKLRDVVERQSAQRDEERRIEDWERAHPNIWTSQASPGPASQPASQPSMRTQPPPAAPPRFHLPQFRTAL